MSTSYVRQLVKKNVEEQVLLEVLGDKYSSTPQEEKDRIRSGDRYRELIDINVDKIINAFLQDIQKGSADAKRAKRYNIFASAMNLVLSAGLAHAVNLENIPYLAVCIFGLIGIQVYSIFKGF
ncbi:hypothetical protein K3L72_14655 [Bacillus altitudinis]|uniref:hypothetical protein n=1 Tax=Bacillus altitudinis TaxID=293387 RepID=UPI0022364D07|nr:hypothetical protein [Bacillus altitudinis]MCW4359018.1 hypothetical protein [Bacillus altitudinis]